MRNAAACLSLDWHFMHVADNKEAYLIGSHLCVKQLYLAQPMKPVLACR